MRTGLRLMFAPRFMKYWYSAFGILISTIGGGMYIQGEWDKEAYAMRGRSNLFRKDYEKLKASGSNRELWS